MAALEVLALNESTPQIRAPGTGDTYSAPRKVAIAPEANSNALAVTGYSLTGANAQSLVDLAGTWNTSGTPTAIKMNVTDTASAAASLLLDLQVGGSSKFKVKKDGFVTIGSGGIFDYGSGQLGIGGASADYIYVTSNGLQVVNRPLLFGSSIGSFDVYVYRDAANTLALRNSTNAQTFNTYGTYTDASNYRRVKLTMTTGGVASLSAEGAGTGASGNVLHISSLPTSNPGPGILWNNAGTPAIGT